MKIMEMDSWAKAAALSRADSDWSLEYFKASLEQDRATSTAKQKPFSRADKPTLTLRLLGKMHFMLAAALGLSVLTLHLIRFSRSAPIPTQYSQKVLAIHGEWTSRTRHVLSQVGAQIPTNCLLILGRPTMPLPALKLFWEEQLGHPLPPLVTPFSISAACKALPTMLKELTTGLQLYDEKPQQLSIRKSAAIIFRVLLGTIMQKWWTAQCFATQQVIYGHTGTADTNLLERTQQKNGLQTVHLVHGLSTGPNFVGISDHAVFRCGYDADMYRQLGIYRKCTAPVSTKPTLQRGKQGLLLLTNLAHPMNAGYLEYGLRDEIRILRDVAKVAAKFMVGDAPKLWKPHPVLSMLPQAQQEELRKTANELGYREITLQTDITSLLRKTHWIISTPSTVAADILAEGQLTIIVDWQQSTENTAIAQTGTLATNSGELIQLFNRLGQAKEYETQYSKTWDDIRPSPQQLPSNYL